MAPGISGATAATEIADPSGMSRTEIASGTIVKDAGDGKEKNEHRNFQYDKRYIEDKTLTKLKLKIQAIPGTVKPGGSTEIRVTVLTKKRRRPVPNAKVKIIAETGIFTETEAKSVEGATDEDGYFKTAWSSDGQVLKTENTKHSFSVQVSKPGYRTAKRRGMVRIEEE